MIWKQINKSILILFLVFSYANITFSFWPFEWNLAFSVFPNSKKSNLCQTPSLGMGVDFTFFLPQIIFDPKFFQTHIFFWPKNFHTEDQYSNYQNIGVKFSIFWEPENYLRKIKNMRVIFSIFWEKNMKWELI